MAKFRVETQLSVDKGGGDAANAEFRKVAAGARQASIDVKDLTKSIGAGISIFAVLRENLRALAPVMERNGQLFKKMLVEMGANESAVKAMGLAVDSLIHPTHAMQNGIEALAEASKKIATAWVNESNVVLNLSAAQLKAVDSYMAMGGAAGLAARETARAAKEQEEMLDNMNRLREEYQREEERAAEERKRRNEEYRQQLQAILDRVNPVAAAERELQAQIAMVSAELAKGGPNAQAYQDAIAALRAELDALQHSAELVAQTIPQLDIAARSINTNLPTNPWAGGSMTVSQSPYVEEMMRAEEQFSANLSQGMGAAAASFAREFIETGELNIQRLGDMLLDVLLDAAMQYFAQMVTNQAKLKMEGGASGASGGGGMSGMGWFAVAAIAIEAYAAHIAKSDKKDYTELGADRTVGISGGNVTSSIGLELDAGFKDQLLEAMNAYLEAFREVTGGVITGLGDIMVDVRQDGKEWKAQFNGEIIGYFDSLEGAMMAGIQAAFKAEEFAGALDPILRQVVENYQGDAKEFLSALQRVGSVLDEINGLSEIEIALTDLPQKSAALASELQGMGIAASDAAVLAAKWNAVQLQNLRDQITGHQQSEAEMLAQRQREAEMFNAQLALDKAKNDAEILNLQNQIAIENAKIDVLNAANQAQLAILNASLAAYQQIAAIYSSIAPIAMGEIRIPRAGRGGGHGGGSTTPTGPTPEEIAAQLAADIADFWEGIAAGWRGAMGGVAGQFLELNQWYEEQAARARELGIPLEELNALYDQQLANLAHDTLAGLGLQSVTTTNQFLELQESLKFLVEWGAITEDQMRELGDSMYISLVDSLLQYVDNEDVRRQLEDLRFRMEMANYQLQFQMLLQLGLLTQAEIDIINGLFGSIQDAYDNGELQFQIPRPRPQQTHTQTNGQSAADAARAEAERALRAALDRLRNAVEGLQEFQESLLLSNVTPLTTSQQFEEAQRQYLDLLAAAQGGDVGAMEQLAGAAQTYLELAAQMYGTSGAGYAAIFDAVSQQVAAIAAMGQHILDSVPPQMAGTEDRLDTIAEILRAMAGLGLGGGGNGTGQNPNSYQAGYVYFGPVHGWHPRGWTPPASNLAQTAALGHNGNLSLGNFAQPGQTLTVNAPSLLAEIRNLADAQKEATIEAKNDRMKKPVASWSTYHGKPIGNRRSG